MKKILVSMSLGLFAVTVGCKYVGGKCDCGNSPGEASIYAPYGSNLSPSTPVTPAKKPETLGQPKEMPKDKPKDKDAPKGN